MQDNIANTDRRTKLPSTEIVTAYRDFAKAIALCTSDWIAIAKSRIGKLDYDNARRCMERAESLAQNAVDWALVADCWSEEFRDYGNKARCVSEAMHVAASFNDWMFLAEHYIEKKGIYADDLEECFYQAELLAKMTSEWNRLARACWRVRWTEQAKAAEDKARLSFQEYIYGFDRNLRQF